MPNLPPSGTPAKPRGWLNRTILGAGLTSALGDCGYETGNVILPGFLAVLGLPPAVLGTIEGAADAISSFTKLGAGYIADRLGHRKTLVAIGYGLTPVGQACIALAGGWPLILFGRSLSWFGRGMRGPLRNAIMAEAVTPETRGRAFGFHRAADTLGAVIGPLLGVLVLGWSQQIVTADAAAPFRFVFWLTLIPGVLSVLSFSFLVRDDRSVPNPHLRFWATLRSLPEKFRRYLGAVGLFGMGDFTHALLILAATQLLTPRWGVVKAAQIAGLLYVGRNILQVIVSYPVGVLADRFGHVRVLVVGYAFGVLTAATIASAFLLPRENVFPALVLTFGFAGVCLAIQEALEASTTAEFVGPEIRGVGYGMLGAVNGVGDLVSSTVVGVIWTVASPVAAFAAAGAVMLAGTVAMSRRT